MREGGREGREVMRRDGRREMGDGRRVRVECEKQLKNRQTRVSGGKKRLQGEIYMYVYMYMTTCVHTHVATV